MGRTRRRTSYRYVHHIPTTVLPYLSSNKPRGPRVKSEINSWEWHYCRNIVRIWKQTDMGGLIARHGLILLGKYTVQYIKCKKNWCENIYSYMYECTVSGNNLHKGLNISENYFHFIIFVNWCQPLNTWKLLTTKILSTNLFSRWINFTFCCHLISRFISVQILICHWSIFAAIFPVCYNMWKLLFHAKLNWFSVCSGFRVSCIPEGYL